MVGDPNVILVISDDEPALKNSHLLLNRMPWAKAAFKDSGVLCTNAFTAQALCGPGRASIFSGRYPAPYQGIPGHEADDNDHGPFDWTHTIFTALKARGYYTMLVGKVLNHWGECRDRADCTQVPLGIDRLHGFAEAEPTGFHERRALKGHDRTTFEIYHQRLGEPGFKDNNVAPTRWDIDDPSASDYATDLFKFALLDAIANDLETDQPFFAVVAGPNPHTPVTPAARHANETSFAGQGVPGVWSPDSYNQVDVSGTGWHPLFMRTHLPDSAKTNLLNHAQAMLALDELMAAVWTGLGAARQLNTIVCYISDNGYFLGEHRLRKKSATNRPASHIPLYWYWPGHLTATPRNFTGYVSHIDVAPTLMAMTGATMGQAMHSAGLGANLDAAARTSLLVELPLQDDTGLETVPLSFRTYDAAGNSITKQPHEDPADKGQTEIYLAADVDELDNIWNEPSQQSLQSDLEALYVAEVDDLPTRIFAPLVLCGRYESNSSGPTMPLTLTTAIEAGWHAFVLSFAGNSKTSAVGATATLLDSTIGHTPLNHEPDNADKSAMFFSSERIVTTLPAGSTALSVALKDPGGVPKSYEDRAAYVFKAKNVKVSDWFDVPSAVGFGTDDVPTSSPLTTSQPGDLVIFGLSYNKDGGTVEHGSGLRLLVNYAGGTGRRFAIQLRTAYSQKTHTGTAKTTNQAQWRHKGWSVKQQGETQPPPPPPEPIPPDPPPLPEDAALTRTRKAMQAELQADLGIAFIPGRLEGPVQDRDLGSVYVERGGEREEDVNTGALEFTIRMFQRYEPPTDPERPFDPSKLEKWKELVEISLKDKQTTLDPSLWFLRVTGFDIDVAAQGVELTVTAWQDNPAVGP